MTPHEASLDACTLPNGFLFAFMSFGKYFNPSVYRITPRIIYIIRFHVDAILTFTSFLSFAEDGKHVEGSLFVDSVLEMSFSTLESVRESLQLAGS